MMQVKYTRSFIKSFKKRIANNEKLDKQLQVRLKLLLSDPTNSLLKDHKLTGAKKHLRAFSVTGDVRVVYRVITKEIILLYDIGSHNQVY